jgi:hypothetical protein
MGGIHFEVGRTADVVDQNFYSIKYNQNFSAAPVFIADMQSYDGGDTSNIRWQYKNTTSVQVHVGEEQSRDDEIKHTSEVVGFMLFDQY